MHQHSDKRRLQTISISDDFSHTPSKLFLQFFSIFLIFFPRREKKVFFQTWWRIENFHGIVCVPWSREIMLRRLSQSEILSLSVYRKNQRNQRRFSLLYFLGLYTHILITLSSFFHHLQSVFCHCKISPFHFHVPQRDSLCWCLLHLLIIVLFVIKLHINFP